MKQTKFFLAAILLPLMFLLLGELYAMYADGAQYNFPSMTLHFEMGESPDKKIGVARKLAEETGLELLLVEKTAANNLLAEKRVYTSEVVRQMLIKDYDWIEGQVNSIFWGRQQISFHPLDQYQTANNWADLFLIGAGEQVENFATAFHEIGGMLYTNDEFDPSQLYITALWVILCTVLLLLTLFEIALSKRQVSVELILGKRVERIVGRHVLTDSAVYSALFLASFFGLRLMTNTAFYWQQSVLFFGGFLLLNALIYCSYFSLDVRKCLSTKKQATKTLKLCYGYKFCTMILCTFLLVFCFQSAVQWIQFEQHHDFFREQKDMAAITITTQPENDTNAEMERDMIREKTLASDYYLAALAREDTASFTNLDMKETTDGINWIFCDRGAQTYLKSRIADFKDRTFENKVYFLMPPGAMTPRNQETLLEMYDAYDPGSWKADCEFLPYRSGTTLASVENSDKTNILFERNPIVIFDNRTAAQMDAPKDIYLCRAAFIKNPDNGWAELLENQWINTNQTYQSNVYDSYLYLRDQAQKTALCALLLAVLALSIEILIMRTLIRYEFVIHGVEFSVKTLLGHRFWDKYRRIFLFTITGELLLLLFSVLYAILADATLLPYLLGSVAVLLAFELFLMVRYMMQMERVNLNKILKGAIL